MSKEEKDELKPIMDVWDSLSPEEINEMDQVFSDMTVGEGDHIKLDFENLTRSCLNLNSWITLCLEKRGKYLEDLIRNY